MKTARHFALSLALLVLCACAHQSFDSRLYSANQGVTVILKGTDNALNAHLISSKQAEVVSTVAHQVSPLLDSAKAASDAHDQAGADKTMKLIDTLIAGLTAYVPPVKK